MLLGKRDQDWFCSSLVFQLSWWLERRQTTVTIFGCPIDFATTVSKDNKLGLSFGIKSLHFHQGIAIVPFPIVLLSDMLCTPIFLPLYFRGKKYGNWILFPITTKSYVVTTSSSQLPYQSSLTWTKSTKTESTPWCAMAIMVLLHTFQSRFFSCWIIEFIPRIRAHALCCFQRNLLKAGNFFSDHIRLLES